MLLQRTFVVYQLSRFLIEVSKVYFLRSLLYLFSWIRRKSFSIVDYVNLMSYDFWTSASPYTGMNAPLFSREGLNEQEQKYNLVIL